MKNAQRAFGAAFGTATALLMANANGGAPPPAADLVPPSSNQSTLTARWVAPFVQYVEVQGRDRDARWEHQSVRWYSRSGMLLARSDSLILASTCGSYFVSSPPSPRGDGRTVHGIYGDWQLPLSSARSHGYASGDGRVLMIPHFGNSAPARQLSIHLRGKLTSELGPFERMTLAHWDVGFDGCVGAVFAHSTEVDEVDLDPPKTRVFAVDTTGTVRVDAEVRGAIWVHVGRNAASLLVGSARGGLDLLRSTGERVQIMPPTVAPTTEGERAASRRLAASHPDSDLVVLIDRQGERLTLLDLATGDSRWTVTALPYPTNVVQPFGPYVFVCGSYPHAPHRNTVLALDLATGDAIAEWSSDASFDQCPSRLMMNEHCPPRLMMRAAGLFYVAGDEFSEIDLAMVARVGEDCCPWKTPRREEDPMR